MSDEAIPLSTTDFEVDAYKILDTAPDYDTGVTTLSETFSNNQFDNPEEAKQILADYTEKLRFKHKAPILDDESLTIALPVKPDEVEGEDTVDRINNWEAKNLESISTSDNIDQIAASKTLTWQIKDYASRARRDALTGDAEEGAVSWAKDKFFRVAGGLVEPFSGLSQTAEDWSKSILERTQESRDKDISSKIASIGGAVGPIVGLAMTPGAQLTVPAVIGAQTVGSANQMYEEVLERTGDRTKATQAGALVGTAGVIGAVPFARIATGLGGAARGALGRLVTEETTVAALGQALKKHGIKDASIQTIEAGLVGSGAGIIAKKAQQVGFDQDVDLTEDVVSDFIANAAVAGTLSTAHVMADNFKIGATRRKYSKFKEDLEAAQKARAEQAKEQGLPIEPEKPYFTEDSEGYLVPLDEEYTIETRRDNVDDYERAKQDYINEEPKPSDVPTDEAGLPAKLDEKPDVDIPFQENRFTLSKRFGELESQVGAWNKDTANKAQDALVNLKESEYLTKRIEDLTKKAETSPDPETGASYKEQIAEYQKELAEITPLIKDDAPGVAEAKILLEKKKVTDELKRQVPGPKGGPIERPVEEVVTEVPQQKVTPKVPVKEEVVEATGNTAYDKTLNALRKRLETLKERQVKLKEKGRDTTTLDEEINFVTEQEQRYAQTLKKARAREVSKEIPREAEVVPEKVLPKSQGEVFLESRAILSTAAEGGARASAPAVVLAKAVTSALKLSRNILDGAYGVYARTKDGRSIIKVLRSLGSDPDNFSSTLAHEVGHAVRYYLEDFSKGGGAESPVLKQFVSEWASLYSLFNKNLDAMLFKEELKDASMNWRPGWDGDTSTAYGKYRNSPEEVFADAFSYLVNAPDVFAQLHPELWKKFEQLLAENPSLNEFWNSIQKMSIDPNEVAKFNIEVQRQARMQQGEKNEAAILKKRDETSPGRVLKRKLDEAYQVVFNKFSPASRFINAWPKEVMNKFYDMYNSLQRGGAVYDHVRVTIDAPITNLLNKFLQEGIDTNLWAQYEASNHLLHDETLTMFKIKLDPEGYMEAAKLVKSLLKQERGVGDKLNNQSETGLDNVLDFNQIHDAESLSNALAKIQLVTDATQVLKYQDFLSREDPQDPKGPAKAAKKYQRAVRALERRKESIPIENVRSKIEQLKANENISAKTIELAKEILRPNAFAARRYLVNPFGRSVVDASREIEFIKNEIGADKFKKLSSYSEQFHKILKDAMMPSVVASGIFSPEMLARMMINSDTYVSYAALKHFTEDSSIDASVRSAIGNIDAAGNELTNTVLKTKMIVERAYHQRSVNSAIQLAAEHAALIESSTGEAKELLRKAGDIKVERVPIKEGQNVFGEKDVRSAKDKEHSYLVGSSNGQYSLYKISGGKGFENMFKNIKDLPGLNWLLYSTDQLSKLMLVRQFKTVFNPGFTFNQKAYDRKLEALMANSLEPGVPLVPMHTSKGLRAIDAQTLKELAHYKETGELTGNLKKLVDLDGAALDESMFVKEGFEGSITAENMLYDMFGKKMPEEGTRLERIGVMADKKLKSTLGRFWDTVGLGPETAARDELRTKVNGFAIGKARGMSDAQAAVFARENFGIPDPHGGGRASPLINKMFLFGRAHANGLRTIGRYLATTPLKTSAAQLAYRIVLPKLPMLTAIMTPAIAAVLGKEASEVYEMAVNNIPENDKLTKNPIPLGWQDGQGNFHNMFDVKKEDIQADWKAWYFRLPQSREITSMTKVFWPLINNLFTDPTKAVAKSGEGAISVGSGNVQPALQYAINLVQIAIGRNPTDFYRMKPIFNEDLQQSAGVGEKYYEYGKYVGASHFPAAVPFNPFKTTEAASTAEKVMQRAPFVGPMLRSTIGISNYGVMEGAKDLENSRSSINAGIRRSTDDNTQQLMSEYRQALSKVNTLGKGWEQVVGPEVANRTHYLISWHTRMWQKYQAELAAALADDDMERYNYLLAEVAESSKGILEDVRSMSSVSSKAVEKRSVRAAAP